MTESESSLYAVLKFLAPADFYQAIQALQEIAEGEEDN